MFKIRNRDSWTYILIFVFCHETTNNGWLQNTREIDWFNILTSSEIQTLEVAVEPCKGIAGSEETLSLV